MVPVVLAAGAVAVLTAVPKPGAFRLAALQGATHGRLPLSLGWVLPAVAGLLAGPVAGMLALGGALLLRRAATGRRTAQLAQRERAGALVALSLLGAELRSGRGSADALAAAAGVACGPAAESLAAAASTCRLGGDVPSALLAEGSAAAGVMRALSACWQVCSAAGGGLAAGVERLEDGLRAAEAQRRAVDAELAGPRATASLLAVLPLAGIGLAAALGAHPVQVLLHSPVGLACLTGGLAFDAAGLLWTRRLVAGAIP